jgi:microcystin-dependent protein
MEPYLGQITIFGFGFPPRGWAQCDGQILPIAQNQSLYSILGTTYGGDGRTSFGLPDFRGRLPMQTDSANPLGRKDGLESVPLTMTQMGQHEHGLRGSTNTAGAGPSGKVLGTNSSSGRGSVAAYAVPASQANLQLLESSAIGVEGAGAPHSNMQPSLALNFCIALQGLYPPRN